MFAGQCLQDSSSSCLPYVYMLNFHWTSEFAGCMASKHVIPIFSHSQCTSCNFACFCWRCGAVLFCICVTRVAKTTASLSQFSTSSLGDTHIAVNAGWGADSAGAWGPSAYPEPPAAPKHFTNTEQPYVDRVTTTALPPGSESTG